ncbi:hypothetical protein RBB77_20585 [Tunturibacter psychrotolerans]|uniref:Uncharacterized protein n=1 Tax=Tunturiibacter psychrotolerans TaxID=3069686 RepID=A0AAU7ZX70_9BACT
MQQAHADFFAGAAFPLDQNGDIGLGYSLQLVSNRLHSGRLAEKNFERREIERDSGFDVVIQGHFFLSALGKNRNFAIRFTYARQAPFLVRKRMKARISWA